MSCFAPSAVAGQDLAGADREYDAGHLREAARAYDEAIRAGGLEPAALVRAHLRLGVLSALAAELERSDRHFAIALALDPSRDAPEELSPEVSARFAALRDRQGGRRVALSIEREDGAFVVSVSAAPEGLAHTLELAGGAWSERVVLDGDSVRVAPPPEASPIEAVLLDEHGNRLARAGARTTAAALIEATVESAPAEGTGGATSSRARGSGSRSARS